MYYKRKWVSKDSWETSMKIPFKETSPFYTYKRQNVCIFPYTDWLDVYEFIWFSIFCWDKGVMGTTLLSGIKPGTWCLYLKTSTPSCVFFCREEKHVPRKNERFSSTRKFRSKGFKCLNLYLIIGFFWVKFLS